MGRRANLIIVRYGEYELFCSHWVENALAVKIFDFIVYYNPTTSLKIKTKILMQKMFQDLGYEVESSTI